jgi:hypothetical protein
MDSDFEHAHGGDLSFSGTSSYNEIAVQAPNPCLNIDGLGPVGLPLTTPDAKLI